jgi:hypothetical protein
LKSHVSDCRPDDTGHAENAGDQQATSHTAFRTFIVKYVRSEQKCKAKKDVPGKQF